MFIEGQRDHMLHIMVCIKQVIDPEAPLSTFKVDPEAKRAIPAAGVPPVLNPYDENALEAALRIKDLHQAKVTAISMGTNLARAVLIKSLAAGADELVIVEDEAFENLDSNAAAYILATAIDKVGKYDIIFTGRQASDTNAGQVGSGIAEITGIPSITVARKIEITEGRLRVERVVSDGYEVVEAPLPALITVSHELGQLRNVPLRELVAAQKKPVTIWKAHDLGIKPSEMRRVRMLELYIPRTETGCQIVEGETDEEAGVNLALKLREAGIIQASSVK
jgi:electron transfer flavoprotein beta subunit